MKPNNFLHHIIISLIFISIIFFTLTIFIIFNSPVIITYEISLYNTYPSFLWILIFIPIILSEIVLILYVFSINIKVKYLLISLSLLIFSYYLIIILPIIKGYIIYGRFDVLTQIGHMKDIIRTGYISVNNPYPFSHIFGVIFSFFSSLNIYEVTNIIPIFYSLFFIMASFIFFKILFRKKKLTIFSLIFITIPLYQGYHNLFGPYQQSFFLLPLTLYFYFKCKESNFAKKELFLLTLFSSFTTLFHPLMGIFMIFIFIFIEIIYIIQENRSYLKNKQNIHKINIYIIITIIICFLIWRFDSRLLFSNIKNLYLWIFENEGISQLQYSIDLLIKVNLSLQNFIILVFNFYGQWIILGVISIVSIFYFIFIKKINKNSVIILLLIEYLFFTMISIITFISFQLAGFGRFYIIAIMFSIFFITSFFYQALKKMKKFKLFYKFIFILTLFVTLLSINYYSIFNIYYSPIISSNNEQVTYSELIGMNNFFKYRKIEVHILNLGIYYQVFHSALYGNDVLIQGISNTLNTTPIPHFGYNNNNFFSKSYKVQQYLILNKISKIYYPSLYPDYEKLWKFNINDFNKLKNDFSVNICYMNGNIEVYQTLSDFKLDLSLIK